jgi:hypothetical protein
MSVLDKPRTRKIAAGVGAADSRPEAKQVFYDLDEGALVYRLDPL